MKIKEWIYDKISNEAAHYDTYIDITDGSRTEMGMIKADEEGYLEVIVEEVLKETEKAMNVRLSTGNVLGSVKGWTCWIPKSQIK